MRVEVWAVNTFMLILAVFNATLAIGWLRDDEPVPAALNGAVAAWCVAYLLGWWA